MKTILLVEDDKINRHMIARYLEHERYTVLVAGDGVKAVAIATSEPVDLILMDMGLPEMDGWEAVRQIRAHFNGTPLPIIALTAYAMNEERERCLAVGCNDYEPKPIDFPQLLAKMKQFLSPSL